MATVTSAAAIPATRTRIILIVCCVAQLMVVLDGSIVNVALSRIGEDLALSPAGLQWVVTAYILTFAGFLLLGGRLSDLLSRKWVFFTGMTLFTVFSLAGGLAPNGGVLIAARALQGLGGALLAPATLSSLLATFREPAARQRALGYWSAVASVGVALGVILGGILTQYLGWRWVLFVVVPFGVVLAVLIATTFPATPSRPRADRAFDIPGTIAVTAGLVLINFGIANASDGWARPGTIIPLVVGVAAVVLFLLIESRWSRRPLLHPSIFRAPGVARGNVLAFTTGAALLSLYYFMALLLQRVEGFSPVLGGLALLPSAIGTMAASLTGPRITARIGARWQILIGTVLAIGGVLWIALASPSAGYLVAYAAPLLLVGIGFGLLFVPMTSLATSGVAHEDAGAASGLVNTTRQFGGALGIAILSTVAIAVTGPVVGDTASAASLADGYRVAIGAVAVLLAVGAIAALTARTTRASA